MKTKDPSGLVVPFIMVGDDPNLLTCRPTDMPFPTSEPSVPFITNPFTSTCCRFDVDPIKEYGLTEKQVKRFKIEEDIKKYYDIAMKLDWQDGWYSSDEMKKEAKTPGYKHIHLGGSDTSREEYEIEQDWVKEIWEQVNPGMKLLRHYLNGHHKGQSGGIHIDGWTADQYTAILYLTPGWEPEDGGTLELWTPNLNDEQKAMAISTPYGLNGDPSKNIIKSYWPRAGRVVLFDARIPHVARSVETDKFRVSLVFKGTTQGYKSEEPVKPSKVGV